MRQLIVTLMSIMMFALTACASNGGTALSNNSLLGGIAVYKATEFVITQSSDPQARAERITVYCDIAEELITSDQVVTLDYLYERLVNAIEGELPPPDVPLAMLTLSEFRDRLTLEIAKDQALSPATEVALMYMVERIRYAAEYYSDNG
ncbi:MAG: hypothetical protein RKH07_12645 [Gammaproteobacteria bacterium]